MIPKSAAFTQPEMKKLILFGIILVLHSTLAEVENVLVEEGSEHKITCSWPISDNILFIIWTKNRPQVEALTSALPLAMCRFLDHACTNYQPDQFTAMTFRNTTRYTSKLTINRVTPDLREKEISCTEHYSTSASSDAVRSWFLEVYSPPEAPECKAGLTDNGDNMYVMCSTSKVYPGLGCRILQRVDCEVNSPGHQCNRQVVTEWVTVPSAHRPIYKGETLYYTAHCYIIFNPERIGVYRFYVSLYPDITNPFSVTPVKKRTNAVIVLSLQPEATAEGLKKTSQEGSGNQSPTSVSSEQPVRKRDRITTTTIQMPNGKDGKELNVPTTTQTPSCKDEKELNIATNTREPSEMIGKELGEQTSQQITTSAEPDAAADDTRNAETTLISSVEAESEKLKGVIITVTVIGICILIVVLIFLSRRLTKWAKRSHRIKKLRSRSDHESRGSLALIPLRNLP